MKKIDGKVTEIEMDEPEDYNENYCENYYDSIKDSYQEKEGDRWKEIDDMC